MVRMDLEMGMSVMAELIIKNPICLVSWTPAVYTGTA